MLIGTFPLNDQLVINWLHLSEGTHHYLSQLMQNLLLVRRSLNGPPIHRLQSIILPITEEKLISGEWNAKEIERESENDKTIWLPQPYNNHQPQ